MLGPCNGDEGSIRPGVNSGSLTSSYVSSSWNLGLFEEIVIAPVWRDELLTYVRTCVRACNERAKKPVTP